MGNLQCPYSDKRKDKYYGTMGKDVVLKNSPNDTFGSRICSVTGGSPRRNKEARLMANRIASLLQLDEYIERQTGNSLCNILYNGVCISEMKKPDLVSEDPSKKISITIEGYFQNWPGIPDGK